MVITLFRRGGRASGACRGCVPNQPCSPGKRSAPGRQGRPKTVKFALTAAKGVSFTRGAEFPRVRCAYPGYGAVLERPRPRPQCCRCRPEWVVCRSGVSREAKVAQAHGISVICWICSLRSLRRSHKTACSGLLTQHDRQRLVSRQFDLDRYRLDVAFAAHRIATGGQAGEHFHFL